MNLHLKKNKGKLLKMVFLLLHIFFYCTRKKLLCVCVHVFLAKAGYPVFYTICYNTFIAQWQLFTSWNQVEKTVVSFVLIILSQQLSAGRSPWCVWPQSKGCRQRCGWTRWACSPQCSRLARSSPHRAPPSGPGLVGTAVARQSRPNEQEDEEVERLTIF